MTIKVEPTVAEHISLVIDRLPLASKVELEKAYPWMTAREVLEEALLRAKEAYTVFIDGNVVAIFGVTVKTELSNVANPWLIPTIYVARHKKTLLPASKHWIEYLNTKYPVLENVGTSNPQNARWLRWLGFRVIQIDGGYQVYRRVNK